MLGGVSPGLAKICEEGSPGKRQIQTGAVTRDVSAREVRGGYAAHYIHRMPQNRSGARYIVPRGQQTSGVLLETEPDGQAIPAGPRQWRSRGRCAVQQSSGRAIAL